MTQQRQLKQAARIYSLRRLAAQWQRKQLMLSADGSRAIRTSMLLSEAKCVCARRRTQMRSAEHKVRLTTGSMNEETDPGARDKAHSKSNSNATCSSQARVCFSGGARCIIDTVKNRNGLGIQNELEATRQERGS